MKSGTEFTVAQFQDAVFAAGWPFAYMEGILHGCLSKDEMEYLVKLLEQEISKLEI